MMNYYILMSITTAFSSREMLNDIYYNFYHIVIRHYNDIEQLKANQKITSLLLR